MSEQKTIYPSAARTATPAAFIDNPGYDTTLRVVVDLTAFTTAASLTVTIDVLDQLTNKWVNVVSAAAITAVSTVGTALAVGIAGPFRVTVTHGNANSHTYSVTAHLGR